MQRLQYYEMEVDARHEQHASTFSKLAVLKEAAVVEEKWKLLEVKECTTEKR